MKKAVKTIAIPNPRLTHFSFEPADGGAQRAGDEESDDEHEKDWPELDQQPEGRDDENKRRQGLG